MRVYSIEDAHLQISNALIHDISNREHEKEEERELIGLDRALRLTIHHVHMAYLHTMCASYRHY